MSLTYPVPAGSRYVVFDRGTGRVITKPRHWPNRHGTEIPFDDPDHLALLVTRGTPPEHDPATHRPRQTGWAVDLDQQTYHPTYDTVELPKVARIERAIHADPDERAPVRFDAATRARVLELVQLIQLTDPPAQTTYPFPLADGGEKQLPRDRYLASARRYATAYLARLAQ